MEGSDPIRGDAQVAQSGDGLHRHRQQQDHWPGVSPLHWVRFHPRLSRREGHGPPPCPGRKGDGGRHGRRACRQGLDSRPDVRRAPGPGPASRRALCRGETKAFGLGRRYGPEYRGPEHFQCLPGQSGQGTSSATSWVHWPRKCWRGSAGAARHTCPAFGPDFLR